MRTFVAEGVTVVTHHMNREYYEQVVFSPAPRTLEPDSLSLLNPDQLPTTVMELVNGKYVINDGKRELELYPVPPFGHTSDIVIAYLPRERMLINTDVYIPPEKGKPLPKPNEDTRALLDTIQRLGLDVSTRVGLRGVVGSEDDLVKIVGQSAAN
jgi:glyoxylase-like metal-dependent hydrolase (beta-lactamase superfamily II)